MTKPFSVDASSTGRVHYKAPLESDHLGQWDLTDPKNGKPREVVVRIESVTLYVPPVAKKKRMVDGTYKAEKLNKYDIRFVGKRKSWISGPVTQATIAALHGNVLQDWIGKDVTLYVDPKVMMGKNKVGGIRVRNTMAIEEPTEDPLDNEVDARVAELHDQAFGREPGSDDV